MLTDFDDAMTALNILENICKNVYGCFTVNEQAEEILDEYLEECIIARNYLNTEGDVEPSLLAMTMDNPAKNMREFFFYGLDCGEVIIRYNNFYPEEIYVSIEDTNHRLVHGTILHKPIFDWS